MEAPDCVRVYKTLAKVERAVRSLRTFDLKARPIHDRKHPLRALLRSGLIHK